MKTQSKDVLIIGAGLSGLSVAYSLKKADIEYRIIDAAQCVGSSWNARHPSLRLNTHRYLSTMADHTYPKGTSAFPTKLEVETHLHSFAQRHNINVEFGIKVDRIQHLEGKFIAHTAGEKIVARNLILATGQERTPHIPFIQGAESFKGDIIHSSAFQAASYYDGKRVLVVGGGNSGFDLMNHLSKAAPAKLWLSARGGSAVLPKRLFGTSLHRYAALVDLLPTSAADILIAAIERVAFGNLTKIGWPKTKVGGATRLRQHGRAIPIDDGTIAAIANGKIAIIGEIAEIDGPYVTLTNGDKITPDVIIAATGYRTNFAELFQSADVVDAYGTISADRSGRALKPDGLWIIGQYPTLQSYFRTAQLQAEAVAKDLSARIY